MTEAAAIPPSASRAAHRVVERSAVGPDEPGWPTDATAVLVHGAMDRGAGMARLARRLSAVPTLRYDRRGYGHARGLEPGPLALQVDDLVNLVADRRVVLFGHSFGGLVALAAAAGGRIDVAALALYEVPLPWLPWWPGWDLSDHVAAPVSDEQAAALADGFLRAVLGPEKSASLSDSRRAQRISDGHALLADVDPALRAGVPFAPDRVRTPCVAGYGSDSPARYRRAADWLAETLPAARVRRLEGADHAAPLTRAGDVAQLIYEAAGAGR